MKDNVNALESVTFCVLGNALDGLPGYVAAHAFWHPAPRLIGHLIDITVGTRQIVTTMDLQDKLPKRDGLVPCCAHRRRVQSEQRPGCGMLGYLDRCHGHEAARLMRP